MIFTTDFWKGAGERAVKTFSQALIAVITASEVIGILDVDWAGALAAAGLAALLSLLTSVGNADFVAGTPVVIDVDRSPVGENYTPRHAE